MTTPMFAELLRVVHHDEQETVYENVRYWPWGGGNHVDIFDPDGRIVVQQHKDVVNLFTGTHA